MKISSHLNLLTSHASFWIIFSWKRGKIITYFYTNYITPYQILRLFKIKVKIFQGLGFQPFQYLNDYISDCSCPKWTKWNTKYPEILLWYIKSSHKKQKTKIINLKKKNLSLDFAWIHTCTACTRNQTQKKRDLTERQVNILMRQMQVCYRRPDTFLHLSGVTRCKFVFSSKKRSTTPSKRFFFPWFELKTEWHHTLCASSWAAAAIRRNLFMAGEGYFDVSRTVCSCHEKSTTLTASGLCQDNK